MWKNLSSKPPSKNTRDVVKVTEHKSTSVEMFLKRSKVGKSCALASSRTEFLISVTTKKFDLFYFVTHAMAIGIYFLVSKFNKDCTFIFVTVSRQKVAFLYDVF